MREPCRRGSRAEWRRSRGDRAVPVEQLSDQVTVTVEDPYKAPDRGWGLIFRRGGENAGHGLPPAGQGGGQFFMEDLACLPTGDGDTADRADEQDHGDGKQGS